MTRVPGTDNGADILTKAVNRETLERLRNESGVMANLAGIGAD